MNRCPECGGFEINPCSEGHHCRNCGLVIDDSPFEKNAYIPENVKRHASHPGFAVAGSMPVHGRYVKHHWLMSTRQKNLFKAKMKLKMISSKLGLPKTVEKEAYLIFRSAVDKDINVGRGNAGVLYASVYVSCILHGIPKTPLEIISFSGVSKKRMLNAYRVIKSELKLRIEPIDPLDFVQRFGSRLELKQSTLTLASELVEKLKKSPVIVGKQPKTIVASAIYVASRMNRDYRSQREVANATGVIEVTIRKRSIELVETLDFN